MIPTNLSEETFDRRAKFAKTRPHVKLAAKRVVAFVLKKKALVGSLPKSREYTSHD